MDRKYPAYMPISSLLAQTTFLGGLTYAVCWKIGPKRHLGIYLGAGLALAFLMSVDTTLDVIKSRWSLPSEAANGKPSH